MRELIDRAALIAEYDRVHVGSPGGARKLMEDAPIIEERKKGEWIDNHTTCSECGWQMIDDVMESPNMVGFNYCPNCGADMRGGQE